MRIVIAIGGNSLIQDKYHISAHDQYQQVVTTSQNLLGLIQDKNEIVITHGNGPQVGYLLRMSELATEIPLFPLDYCVANTQGSIGYQIQNSLERILRVNGIDKQAVTIITQVVVDPNDSAFMNPSKPIGSFFSKIEIEKFSKELGWKFIEDSGRGYRRIVPSPTPLDIIEKDAIATLLINNFIVIASGGGGIPVIQDQHGYQGIEAVIDKDFASSLLAQEIHADLFMISTAVDCVYIRFNQPDALALREVHVAEMESYLLAGYFGKGSMEPKIKAALQFTKKTGNRSVITSPEQIQSAIEGHAGTTLIP